MPHLGGGFTGLLDDIPGAAIALSVRRLNSAYTGPCMRIVRESDEAELDIGFVGDLIDISAAQSFIGSSTGYIATWYDQSGNGVDAIGMDYGGSLDNMTELIDNGDVQYLNSIPAVWFDHPRAFMWSDSGSQITDFIGTGAANTDKAVTMHVVCQQGSLSTQPWKLLFEDSVSQSYILQMYENSGERIDFGNTAAALGGSYTYDAQVNMISRVTGNTFEGFENGVSIGSNTNGSVQNPGSITGVDFRIGGGSFPTRNLSGFMQELIVWPTSEDITDIFNNADAFYSF